jgi:8-oxo-dGTP diphosphatase
MLHVVAAIIERNGRILICRRTASQTHPLQWEFPGGKVEPGETPPQALAGELEEELGIIGVRADELTRYEYRYPGKAPFLLIFFRVNRFSGEPENKIFHEISWETREALAGFDFVDGDRQFLARFAATPGV